MNTKIEQINYESKRVVGPMFDGYVIESPKLFSCLYTILFKKDNFIPFLPSMEDFAIDTRDLLLFVSSNKKANRKDVTFLKQEMKLFLILIQKLAYNK